MSLELFPLDSQICHITLASYGWTDDDVKYIWKVGLNLELVKKIYIYFSRNQIQFKFRQTFSYQEGLTCPGWQGPR